ncbi:MAG TPA: LamG domain-containing protein [Polyangia bacterium]|nr:LamG domain-containing protein [Polyangia bacterium]
MAVGRAALPIRFLMVLPVLSVLPVLACGAQQAPGLDGGTLVGDGLTFDIPPIPDGSAAGYALSFDGTKDYATAGNGGFPLAGGPQTLEMWVNYDAASGTQDFLDLRTDFSSGVQLGIHDGALAAWRVYVDRVLVQAPTAPTAGSWHHLAYTFDATTHVLYVDGAAVDSETGASDDRTPTSVWLGTSDGSSDLFKGEMDEVRVWTVTRTAAEVAADMAHTPPGAVPGLVAYWTFDDAINGGRSVDFSGSGNDVTLGDGVASLMPNRVPSTAPVGN